MLGPRWQQAQIELQSHRRWLRTFVSPLHVLHHPRPRLPIHRPALLQRNAAASFASKRHTLRSTVLRPLERTEAPSEQVKLLASLRVAVSELRIKDVIHLYHTIKDKSVFGNQDFRLIAQCVHYFLRSPRDSEDRRDLVDELVGFAEDLVKDVRNGKLAPNRQAHVHLLGFFKESRVRDGGVRFWTWLQAQDDRHVNADVYGAAIELLAVNGASLAEMEELYQQALSRFPGNFAAYHLSPEAVLPDRQSTTTIPGIPMSLLQGILTARLLHGDSRNAYLALDTAIRLYPDQTPRRFFTMFLEERPISEAFTALAIALRGGSPPPNHQFKTFQKNLSTTSDLGSTKQHSLMIRAMLSSMYLWVGAGGRINPNMVNELIIAITRFFRLKGILSLEAKKKQQIVAQLMDIIRSSLAIFARYGGRPGVAAFNSIIGNVGGNGHSKQTIGIALSDANALGIQPTDVTHRSVLAAAGVMGDKELVLKAWKNLVQLRLDSGQQTVGNDWHTFLYACRATDQIDFAKQELENSMDKLVPHDRDSVLASFENVGMKEQQAPSTETFDASILEKELEKIRADLEVMDERTRDQSQMYDFSNKPLQMTLLPGESKATLPEPELMKIYDELTTEQRSSRTPEQASAPSVSVTNIPLGLLRYENWKCINWLLEESQANDEAYYKSVDEAIAAGRLPPQRTKGGDLGDVDVTESYGLSDLARADQRTKREKPATEEEVRKVKEHILRLRGREA